MEILKVIQQDGEYRCDIDISVEEWKEILQDKTISTDNYKDILLKFYAEPEHKSTCESFGKKYDVHPQSPNSTITNFAKAVQKKLNRFEVIGADGKPTFWIIPMLGKNVGKHFEWAIRPELVKAIEDVFINENYLRFKKLLEYFVAHLEFCVTNDKNNDRYNSYIKDVKNFNKSGQGHKGQKIQNQIKDWDSYPNGKICININPTVYKTGGCYLNWDGTAINVNAIWDKDSIAKLKLVKDSYPLSNSKDVLIFSMNDLGLFDNNSPNDILKTFFDKFNELIISHRIEQKKRANMLNLQPYIELLEANKNLILTGAPGTGKTYLAKQIAKSMNAEKEFVQFHPSYDYTDFVEGLRPLKKDNGEFGFELKDGIFKVFCKKAQRNINDSKKSEDELKKEDIVLKNISDFLDKCIDDGDELELSTGNKFTIFEYNETYIKIKVPNNAITSDLTLPFSELSQLLLNEQKLNKVKDVREFFNRSHNRQSDSYIFTLYNNSNLKKELKTNTEITKIERKDYVFIIDEINRTEMSKVLGELFFSIDPGYRGIDGKVKTQYANLQESDDIFADGFFVPKNVYIIGTMNDIDRSVESMDFAMRRRFAWQEIKAEDRISMWDGNIDTYKEDAKIRMSNLNSEIDKIPELGSAYCIGPAYFLKLKEYDGDFQKLWINHIQGVLFEYLRGLPNSKNLLKKLEDKYNLVNGTEND